MRDIDVRERVRAILAHQALRDPADLRDDTALAEIGLDSLALVDTIFAIEEAFGIAVPFNANAPEAGSFDASTVGSVAAAVEGLVARGR